MCLRRIASVTEIGETATRRLVPSDECWHKRCHTESCTSTRGSLGEDCFSPRMTESSSSILRFPSTGSLRKWPLSNTERANCELRCPKSIIHCTYCHPTERPSIASACLGQNVPAYVGGMEDYETYPIAPIAHCPQLLLTSFRS